MKFKELEFEAHSIGCGEQAKVEFENGYSASILFGDKFYSNGIDTYELAVLHKGSITYDTPITDDVLGWLTKDEVTEALEQIEKLRGVYEKC